MSETTENSEVAVAENATTTPPCKDYLQAGNVAAMREAMELMLEWYYELHDDVAAMDAAMEKVRAALSAPPRNCDIGTAEEQYRRFELMCNNNCCNNCKSCPFSDEDGYSELEECVLRWAQMPYEKGSTK